jgi:oxaloacetate decarboxylase gamma subunit
MALDQLIARGGELMLIGMGVVFAFLTLLVLTVHLVSLAIRRLEARQLPAPELPHSSDDAAEAEVVAVITAAVQRYRRRHLLRH